MGQLLGLGRFTSCQNSRYPSGLFRYIPLLSGGGRVLVWGTDDLVLLCFTLFLPEEEHSLGLLWEWEKPCGDIQPEAPLVN